MSSGAKQGFAPGFQIPDLFIIKVETFQLQFLEVYPSFRNVTRK